MKYLSLYGIKYLLILLITFGISTQQTFASFESACGLTTWDLNAGQHIDVGSITVKNDTNYLYVSYDIDTVMHPNASFGTLHVWVGNDLLLLPRSGQNNDGAPVNGHFPYHADASGQTHYTFSIPLAELGIVDISQACPVVLYVVPHAEVTMDDTVENGEHETAYGGDLAGDGNRWWFYGEYSICCDMPKPPVLAQCETAYAKGDYVWTTHKKSNPESLPSLNLTRNRWGWANHLTEPGVYTYDIWAGAGLNNTDKGHIVGTVTVEWDGNEVTVTYDVMADFYHLEEVHLYAGDTAPGTIAPGQYGNLSYLEADTKTYTFNNIPLEDSVGNGVWLVAHAVVCSH